MPSYLKLAIAAVSVFALVAGNGGTVWAGLSTYTVRIDDLTGPPTVTVEPCGACTPLTPTIISSAGEFLHFTLPGLTFSGPSVSNAVSLFDDTGLTELSDQFLLTAAGNGLLDVQFASEPSTIPSFPVSSVHVFESGTFQTVAFAAGAPGTEYMIEVRSGETVPEPATLFLLASGVVGLAGVASRRRRRRPSGSSR